MTTLTQLKERARRAEKLALAARVPDEDRNGPGREPVTVSGWYEIPTISGRDAWVRYDWRNGRCLQGVATYDIEAENAFRDAAAELGVTEWLEMQA